jgi:hypothetical protein
MRHHLKKLKICSSLLKSETLLLRNTSYSDLDEYLKEPNSQSFEHESIQIRILVIVAIVASKSKYTPTK